ncbi:permease-like cell division protein FtsX [Gallaecimonas pentaromativorans]|uniref:Cell division protein FtsX n=1 Tax=Gallaecimonas pentaromativorans TaxID=584787 RepID=A0A3N1PIA6_9GAMM|nr:permease-like cell division protein FtsX [Gallaecimonas pentaromativorans]MED5526737.1 permease-like cell division protein FtsX [Pseudomonadota bacterium]ROQ24286.1 cell division protein FtsX [Gallaecimonas pentaromativorans]
MSLLFENRTAAASAARPGFLSRLAMYFVRHAQQATGSLGELWRTPLASLLTIAVLGFSLTLPGTFYVLLKNIESVSSQFQKASEITLLLKDSVSTDDAAKAATRIGLYPEVAKAKLITRDEALTEFRAKSGFGEALDYLDSNPLPNVIVVEPTERNSSPQAAKALLDKLRGEREVEQGRLDLDWLKRLDALVSMARDGVSLVALLLLVTMVLVVGNTIRLMIEHRRDSINVMKMVGATDAFVRRPFLYTGLWYGLAAGCLSLLLVTLGVLWLEQSVARVVDLYGSQFRLNGLDGSEMLAVLGLSVLLGLSGAYLAVWRHLKAMEPA